MKKLKNIAVIFAIGFSVLLVVFELLFSLNITSFSAFKSLLKATDCLQENSDSSFIEFCDIGQGDCTIIKSGDSNIVIDFGSADDSDKLYFHLKDIGIKELDLAIVTHYHEDHLGGLCDLLERMTVKSVLINSSFAEDCDESTVIRFKELSAQKNVRIVEPEIGVITNVGQSKIEVLSILKEATEENERSVCLKATFSNMSVVFTGDSQWEAETALLERGFSLKADILKLGHHGSSTSTSEKLLDAVDPSVVVASCGYNNSYNHPSQVVVDRIKSKGITLYRTDLDGNITVTTNKNNFFVTTDRGKEK